MGRTCACVVVGVDLNVPALYTVGVVGALLTPTVDRALTLTGCVGVQVVVVVAGPAWREGELGGDASEARSTRARIGFDVLLESVGERRLLVDEVDVVNTRRARPSGGRDTAVIPSLAHASEVREARHTSS